MLRLLLEIHGRQLRGRLRGQRVALGLGLLAAGGLAAALVFAGQAWLDGVAEAELAARVFDRVFWLDALLAFIMGFSGFELLFRAPAAALMETLPVSGRALFGERALVSLAAHLPLLLAAALFEAPLLGRQPGLFAYAMVVHGTLWGAAWSFGLWLHVAAGRSLVSGTNPVKEYFGSGYRVSEAAATLYSPAATFALALLVSVPMGLAARPLASGGGAGPALATGGLLLALCLLAVWRAGASFARHWRTVRPAFREAELLPPWREDHRPARVWGQWLAGRLRPPLAALFLRDLLQLRRRHRFEVGLLGLTLAALGLFHLATTREAAALFAFDALALGLLVTIVANPAFKLGSGELEPPGSLALLAVPRRALANARALVALTQQLPLALGVGLSYGLRSGDLLGALALTAGGLAAGPAVTWSWTRWSGPPRPGRAVVALALRGGLAALALTTFSLWGSA